MQPKQLVIAVTTCIYYKEKFASGQVTGMGEGGGGGGGGCYIKRRGCLLEILNRTPERYQDPVLWAWLEMFCTP